jgi:hypothetical protein
MSTPLPTPPEELLDAALRHELRWEAPPELTNRLLQLVPGATVPSTPDAPLPRWRLYLALGLIVITSLLSIVGAAYFYQILWLQLGIDMILTQLEAWPDRFLQMLYTMVPFAREVISIAALIRDQLHWILLAVILWILLDAAQSEHQLAHNQ